jgi:hypothetical protein
MPAAGMICRARFPREAVIPLFLVQAYDITRPLMRKSFWFFFQKEPLPCLSWEILVGADGETTTAP